MIFSRTLYVPVLANYRHYRDRYLRPDFRFQCAFCLRHEFYFAGIEGGQIDHFRPQSRFPHLIRAYENLYWTCPGCNRAKGEVWPDAADAAERRFLDPCVEDHDAHWSLETDGTLIATTPTGQYTIRHVRLNRRSLTEHRRFLIQKQRQVVQIETALVEADLTPELRSALQSSLAEVRLLLEPPVFLA